MAPYDAHHGSYDVPVGAADVAVVGRHEHGVDWRRIPSSSCPLERRSSDRLEVDLRRSSRGRELGRQ